MDDAQLRRYSRHLLLPEINLDGQEKLLRSRILLVGLGGLGSPVAMYLAASGVGTLALCDHDRVDSSNLQRQIIHRNSDIGRSKAASAAETVRALNPEVHAIPLPTILTGEQLDQEVSQSDLVIDATDNFESRHILNATCVALKTPLVSGAVIRLAGQITSFRFDLSPRPCYHCLYPAQGEDQATCAEAGVLAPLAGVIGSLQAVEALKILLNIGETLQGHLLRIDARSLQWRLSTLKADPACPICSSHASPPSSLEYRTASR